MVAKVYKSFISDGYYFSVHNMDGGGFLSITYKTKQEAEQALKKHLDNGR